MKHVEFEDMIGERDREIASLKGQIEAVTADKDITAKRADDLGRRLKSTEDALKKAKDEAEAQRTANDQAMREKEEAHALALEQAKRELSAVKDTERQEALDKLRGEMSAEKEAALGAARAEAEAVSRKQQERHDTEIYEMQERFRRSMNQQEEKLTGEKARAIEDLQQKHDAQVAELVTSHEKEATALRGEISTRDAKIEDANRLAEQHVAEIGRLTEERDELTRKRNALDGELKTSQVAAEHLRMEGEAAERRIAILQKDLADAQGVRDQLRAKLEGDLARIDKTKQALAVALDLLNEVEPL
jgi:chromosome segregation ATPase